MWAERLARLGIDVAPEQIITAAVITAEFASERFPNRRILPVGDAALVDALRSRGLRLVNWVDLVDGPRPEQADVVVMGMDSMFDQRRLEVVCRQIWGGAPFIVTNDDRRRPSEAGYVPGTGAMVKAVAWATGAEPLVVGKPSAIAAKAALDRLQLPALHVAMVGDQPLSDISMGKAAGMATALVSSEGEPPVDPAALPLTERPDVVISNLTELIDWIERGRA